MNINEGNRIELTAADYINMSKVGKAFNDTTSTLYGHRMADILSFLPPEEMSAYEKWASEQTGIIPTADNGKIGQINPRLSSQEYEAALKDLHLTQLNKAVERAEALARKGINIDTGAGLSDAQISEQINSEATRSAIERYNNQNLYRPTLTGENKKLFIEAVSKNPNYMMQLKDAIYKLAKQHKEALNTGKVYRTPSGKASLLPAISASVNNLFQGTGAARIDYPANAESLLTNAALILYTLLVAGYIQIDTGLNINPIDIVTGNFEVSQDIIEYNRLARKLKLPRKGIFIINDRISGVDQRYRTFTGVDIKVTYAMDYLVGELKGINAISWSIHRSKPAAVSLGEEGINNRGNSIRTIAGSIIFSIFDENPITAIYPEEYLRNAHPQRIVRKNIIRPDDLPPIDLIVIMTNEYGFVSTMTLFGVQFMDSGGSIGINQLVNEEVIQYTALDIDMMHPIQPNADGYIDPFDLTSTQTNAIFDRRSEIAFGSEGAEFYNTYDQVTEQIRRLPKPYGSK
jgi:hypothetical protein